MDPNATLRLIDESEDGSEEQDQYCRTLFKWLIDGGFAPKWHAYPNASKLYLAKAFTGKRPL